MSKAASAFSKPSQGGKTILDYTSGTHQPSKSGEYLWSRRLPTKLNITYDIEANVDTITSVNLSSSGIELQVLNEIAPDLQKLVNLKIFNANDNRALNSISLITLASVLPYWPNLVSFNYSHNNITPSPFDGSIDSGYSFAVGLSNNCKSLHDFDLSHTQLTSSQLHSLLSPLTELTSLSHVNCSRLFIRDEPAEIIMTICDFAKYSNVKDLNISNNRFGGRCVEPLLRLIKLKPDVTIDLQGNFVDLLKPKIVKANVDICEAALIPEVQPILDIASERYFDHLRSLLKPWFLNKDYKNMTKMVIEYVGSILTLKIYSALPALAAPVLVEDASSASTCSVDVISDTLSLSMPLSASPPEVLGEHVSIADFHGS